MKFSKTLLLLFFPFIINAQDCDCAKSLDQLVEAFEENYALFKIKVRSENRSVYDSHLNMIQQKARSTSPANCEKVRNDYLSYFQDNHVRIINTGASEKVVKSKKLSEVEAKKYFTTSKKVTPFRRSLEKRFL